MMTQSVIEYSQRLPDALQQTKNEFEQKAKMAMAAKLFELHPLSTGMAAKLAGMERVTFLLALHRYGVAMIDLEEDQLDSDLENAWNRRDRRERRWTDDHSERAI